LEFWLKKTPAERLQVAKSIIEWAELLYHSNPPNKKLYREKRLPKFHSMDRYDGNIEILTGILGVTFEECYQNKQIIETQGIFVNILNLPVGHNAKNTP
jgi:hypothetical protein